MTAALNVALLGLAVVLGRIAIEVAR